MQHRSSKRMMTRVRMGIGNTSKTLLSQSGFVSKKRKNFDKLNVFIWFFQLLITYVMALS